MKHSAEKLMRRFATLQQEYNKTQATNIREALLIVLDQMKETNIIVYAHYRRKCKHLGLA